MIERRLAPILRQRLAEVPAVVLLGPRQAGKTTLALIEGGHNDAVYLDLESEKDRAKLAEPELYLSALFDRLVILDEVHRVPGLFPILRGLIDQGRRGGRRAGMYLLLGSGSLDILQQSGETLAGRVSYLELFPLLLPETAEGDRLWLRGGFPESFLAASDGQSLRWREDFIRSYLERDIPRLGTRMPAETLRRFWTMLAHQQGGLLNTAHLARNVGIDTRSAMRYIDLLVDLLLVRRLPAWHANVGKRLTKSPKVYLRDSGLLHALLMLGDRETLLSHPVVGPSWEGFVIENVLACAPPGVTGHFYRTGAGAEIDLLLAWPGGGLWAVEIKRSLMARPKRGFHHACADLAPTRRFVLYPGTDTYAVAPDTTAMPPDAFIGLMAQETTDR